MKKNHSYILLIFILILFGCKNEHYTLDKLKVNKKIDESMKVSKVSDISYICQQSGCYIEDNLYVIAYCSSFGDFCVLRCFDASTGEFVWEKYVEGCGHANAICFRPIDRRLYIADSIDTHAKKGLNNTISVIEYDNIENGIVEVIESPARGGIYSIAYDMGTDTFYSTNFTGIKEGEANVIFSYNGIFESVKKEIILLDDYTVMNDPHESSQGVQCVCDGIAYIPYYEPEEIIAGFDLDTGELVVAYEIPQIVDGYQCFELQGIIYNYNVNKFVIVEAAALIECLSYFSVGNVIDKKDLVVADCKLITEMPSIWALSGCYIEDGLYIISHVSFDGMNLILRCIDSKSGHYVWTKIVQGVSYANSICFNPKNRHLFIADCFTYSNENEIRNRIAVLDYDNIERGIIKIVSSPARGGIYSIAYDNNTETFYSTNFLGHVEGDANILVAYTGEFEDVSKEILLDDLTVRNEQQYETMGVQCVVDGVAWFLYHRPYNVIAGYDVCTGEMKFARFIPEKTIEKADVGRPESIMYKYDDKVEKFYIQTASAIVEIIQN